MAITGGCLCGAVRFTAEGDPRRVTHCHCTMCRKAMGSVVATFATFARDRVSWEGERALYESSDIGWREFCPRCGSSLTYNYRPRPERIYVAMGCFDDPSAFPAGFHDFRADKVSWLHVDEDLPDAP